MKKEIKDIFRTDGELDPNAHALDKFQSEHPAAAALLAIGVLVLSVYLCGIPHN